MLAAAIAVVTGCSTTDDELNLVDARAYMLGATAYPAPSITNYYGGLTVYKKKKGKIYNKEKIIACTSSIGGFSIVEDDPDYAESIKSGSISNAWAYTTITNDGTYVKFQGNFEDAECWKSKDDDSFLGFVTDTSKLSEAEYKSITNSEPQVSIYRKAKFDEGTATKYERINTVLKSSITDKDTAIQAFNDLLTGLKAQ